ncbi:MAG: hypothetical protein ACKVJD_12610 [Burkholderiales bacterium]
MDEENGRKEKKSVPKKTSEAKKLEKEQSMEDTKLKQEFLAALVSLNDELTDLYGDMDDLDELLGVPGGQGGYGASLMDAAWLDGITKLQRQRKAPALKVRVTPLYDN